MKLLSWNILLGEGDETDVLACLRCGTEPINNQDISFAINNLVTIESTEQVTEFLGIATITLKVGVQGGIAMVTGNYNAHNKDRIVVISHQDNVTIFDDETDVDDPLLNCKTFVVEIDPFIDPLFGPIDPPPLYYPGCLLTPQRIKQIWIFNKHVLSMFLRMSIVLINLTTMYLSNPY